MKTRNEWGKKESQQRIRRAHENHQLNEMATTLSLSSLYYEHINGSLAHTFTQSWNELNSKYFFSFIFYRFGEKSEIWLSTVKRKNSNFQQMIKWNEMRKCTHAHDREYHQIFTMNFIDIRIIILSYGQRREQRIYLIRKSISKSTA